MPISCLNMGANAPFLFLCEHASNFIPDEMQNLGVDEAVLETHVAIDIGAAALTRKLSSHFDAPAILAHFSRLIIDCNRDVDHPTLIPEVTDGLVVPGNQNLSAPDREGRIQRFYQPFHEASNRASQGMAERCGMGALVGVHSFTPQMHGGGDRPWEISIMWNEDDRLARVLCDHFSALGFRVGEQVPYSGEEWGHTITRHGRDMGHLHTQIEVRQDQIGDDKGVDRWADMLAQGLEKALPILNDKG